MEKYISFELVRTRVNGGYSFTGTYKIYQEFECPCIASVGYTLVYPVLEELNFLSLLPTALSVGHVGKCL